MHSAEGTPLVSIPQTTAGPRGDKARVGGQQGQEERQGAHMGTPLTKLAEATGQGTEPRPSAPSADLGEGCWADSQRCPAAAAPPPAGPVRKGSHPGLQSVDARTDKPPAPRQQGPAAGAERRPRTESGLEAPGASLPRAGGPRDQHRRRNAAARPPSRAQVPHLRSATVAPPGAPHDRGRKAIRAPSPLANRRAAPDD